MGLRICFLLLLFSLLLGFATPTYIKYEVLQNPGRTGRSLLQQKRDCPLDMENMNYTIVTSQCKGPHYTAKVCCRAFKELSCQYRDVLNTDTNNCPVIMFNYLHLYGKYPPGLFSNLCKEGKHGLDCKDIDVAQQSVVDKPVNATGEALQPCRPAFLVPLFLGWLLLLQN
ncbi:PREDICTED: GPI-anchored protein LLG2-like isoform X1 [Ipomoea nil]|uniref:GPI-anchored protein LLG2-like isoform X1 n=1 Tax=Ipomoea nil TaxID=35883 RepID=UPI000900A555|nr:PREDICTED: GPI-anchored protein LLG2-like isoform X1 [Ipomoea nil]